MDESGDIGVHPPGSRFFVISVSAVKNLRELDRIIKRTRSRFHPYGGLKFSNSHHALRTYVMKAICSTDISIVWAAIDKKQLTNIEKRNELYLSCALCAIKMAIEGYNYTRIDLAIDNFSWRKISQDDFVRSIIEDISDIIKDRKIELCVHCVSSQSLKGLQVHDFITGAIFQRLERNNDYYYNIIKNKISDGAMINWQNPAD
ncbi:MAG TPA: DUF3800 domain-containing protein [Methanomassiliicoccales archaeon]|nr:DUF3800 domain-containing protein [Methanomassiliicoccales archaeon]